MTVRQLIASPPERTSVGGVRGVRDLEAAAARLRGAGVLDLLTARPGGGGWLTLPAALATVPAWHAELAHRHGDRRAAAAFLSAWLAGTPALVVGLPALVGGAVAEISADGILLRRHHGGWIERYAVRPATVTTDGDPEVAAARRIAELTAPIVERVCRALPIGSVAVWGGVADTLGAAALGFARAVGADERRAWHRVERLLDELGEHAPVRYRPRLFPVAWSAGTSHFPVRATCCLYYRTGPEEGAGAATCTTCPLRDDESRTDRLIAHLESSP